MIDVSRFYWAKERTRGETKSRKRGRGRGRAEEEDIILSMIKKKKNDLVKVWDAGHFEIVLDVD